MQPDGEENNSNPTRGWRIAPDVVAVLDVFVKNARTIGMPIRHHHVVAAALRRFFMLPPAIIRDLLNQEIGTASPEFDNVVDGARASLTPKTPDVQTDVEQQSPPALKRKNRHKTEDCQ